MRHLVKWSEKLSAFGHGYQVSAIGGTGANGGDWKVSEVEAMDAIESGIKTYFIVLNGSVCDLVVGREGGMAYLKTGADIDLPHGLLALPDFSSAGQKEERTALVA